MSLNNIFFKSFKKDRFLLAVIFLSVVFFVITSILPFFQIREGFLKFFSPDENANYIFTKLYQESGRISIFEKYNLIAEDIIRPRSYFALQGELKPVSFLGIIIIYGSLARILGAGIIPFLTPFFSALALFFYYLLIKKLFGQKRAFVSFLILFSFPVWLYYSARSMFHNVLFVSFLIIGLYFLVKLMEREAPSFLDKKKDRIKYYCRLFSFEFLNASLGGIFIGLAIASRSSELIWLLPSALLFLILSRRKITFFRLSLVLCFAFLALLPFFYHNQILYNSPFYGGYNEMNRSLDEISSASESLFKSVLYWNWSDFKGFAKIIFNTVFYFGFHPRQSGQMFNYYVIKMFWYLFWPFVLGLLYSLFFLKKIWRKIWPYASSWLLLSTILILYYGSWTFVDNPDPSRFTIGNSYTRYWLPIYLGLIPFVAIFVLNFHRVFFWIKNKLFQRYSQVFISLILILLLSFTSFSFVYSGSEEGLKHYFPNSRKAQEEFTKVLSLTEPQAIIITEYHDKFIFPERKVIVGRFNDNNMNHHYARLLDFLPLYYFNFTFPADDLDYLNNRRLKEFGMNIDLIEEINENFSLYRLKKYDL